MTEELAELTAIIGAEVSLGEELLDNLSAQRQAILGWKISHLIERIENRETLLSGLDALETRRKRVIGTLGCAGDGLSLGEILGAARPLDGAGELGRLRDRARRIYTRLESEEKSLLDLMENLLAHIREALRPLTRPAVSLYGGAAPARPSSGLIQGKI